MAVPPDNSPHVEGHLVHAMPASSEAAGAVALHSRSAGPRCTILIAERDQSVRKLQGVFLERAGFTVVFADDGDGALERALESRPALIITEILIPKMDGLALCRALRQDARTRDTPVIVFSILGASQRAYEAGASAFLRKPLVDSTFVAAVEALIAAQPPSTVETQ